MNVIEWMTHNTGVKSAEDRRREKNRRYYLSHRTPERNWIYRQVKQLNALRRLLEG